MAPLRRRRRDDEFDFKRSAEALKDANAEPWFLEAEDEPGDAPDIEAGQSARFEPAHRAAADQPAHEPAHDRVDDPAHDRVDDTAHGALCDAHEPADEPANEERPG